MAGRGFLSRLHFQGNDMRFKFTGTYTGPRDSVVVHGVRFEGREAVNVEDEATVARLRTHPEVETVAGRPPKLSPVFDKPEADVLELDEAAD